MKDLQLPPRPTFTGSDLNVLYNDLKKSYTDIETKFDANKNCLNCINHIFETGVVLQCKIHPRNYRKICEEWKQL